MTFIKMRAPAQNDYGCLPEMSDEQFAGVTRYTWRRKARQLFIGNPGVHLEIIDGVVEPAAKNHREGRAQPGGSFQTFGGGSG